MDKKQNQKLLNKKPEDLEFRDDFMFGTVMRNPRYCKAFLETILGIGISRITYLDSQDTIALSADMKSVRLDIYVEDEKGTVYNVEMQTGRKSGLPKRTRYYQGMIDLNILEKGAHYRDLRYSFIIFICTFDLFGEGRHIYTFENRCIQNPALSLGDGAVKLILNTKGIMDDVSLEMRHLLDYIDGKMPEDEFTRELDEAVRSVRNSEKWRVNYMTLQMRYQEKYEEGVEQGIEQGRTEGKAEGKAEGIRLTKAVLRLDKKGLDVMGIAAELSVSEEIVREILGE